MISASTYSQHNADTFTTVLYVISGVYMCSCVSYLKLLPKALKLSILAVEGRKNSIKKGVG